MIYVSLHIFNYIEIAKRLLIRRIWRESQNLSCPQSPGASGAPQNPSKKVKKIALGNRLWNFTIKNMRWWCLEYSKNYLPRITLPLYNYFSSGPDSGNFSFDSCSSPPFFTTFSDGNRQSNSRETNRIQGGNSALVFFSLFLPWWWDR